jgi:hypothetical protein
MPDEHNGTPICIICKKIICFRVYRDRRYKVRTYRTLSWSDLTPDVEDAGAYPRLVVGETLFALPPDCVV